MSRIEFNNRVAAGWRRYAVWLAVVVPVVVLIAAAGIHAVEMQRCASCHLDEAFVAATEASGHASVECSSCHGASGLDRIAFGVQHLGASVVGSSAGRDLSKVADVRCLSCHEAVDSSVVETRGIRIDHASCAQGASCTDCHSATAHGETTSWVRVYDMETCLSCHTAQQVAADCDLCHAGQRPAERITSGIFAVTHGTEWQKTHGMGDASTCTVCHTAASCVSCHGVGLPHESGFLSKHSEYAVDPGEQCSTCHQQSFCNDCHGLSMPHSNQFVRGHAADATENRDLCSRCHVDTDCTTCHVKHIHPGGAIGALSGPDSFGGGER